MRTRTFADPRIASCQHSRLKSALQWNGATPSSVSAAKPESRGSDGSRVFRGAAVSVLAALVWMMVGATISVDFSEYGPEPTTPQVVSTDTVQSPSFETP